MVQMSRTADFVPSSSNVCAMRDARSFGGRRGWRVGISRTLGYLKAGGFLGVRRSQGRVGDFYMCLDFCTRLGEEV
jgi:hypothetical protein